MDKFGRLYAYFLLITSGIAALMRLLTPRRLASINSQRLQPQRRRNRYRWAGLGVMLGSLLLIPLYFFFPSHQTWMLLAAGVGTLSGAEFIANARAPEEPSLLRQNQVFGGLYALATVLVYVFAIR